MINKITRIILLLSASFFLLTSSAFAANAVSNQIQCGVNSASNVPGCDTPAGAGVSLTNLISEIINILSLLVGAAAVIMVIVGGFRYVASAGNDSATAAAKKTITYALVGLVIAATAQILVHFVLNAVDNPSTADSSSSSNGTGAPSSGGHGQQAP